MSKPNDLYLPSGRLLRLHELRQYYTYEGLIEGLPTDRFNKRKIEGLMKESRDGPYPGEPYLIEPTETPIEWNSDRPYPFGKPARLPEVTCIGRYLSRARARGGLDFSRLVVIWFQDEFAFPIDQTVVDKILAIDWEMKAIDFEI